MKKLNLLVVSALLALGLASCGNDTPTPSSSEEEIVTTESTSEEPVVDLAKLAGDAYATVSATYDAFATGIAVDQELKTTAEIEENSVKYTFSIAYEVAEAAKTWLAISETGDKLLVTPDKEDHALKDALTAKVSYENEVKYTKTHNVKVSATNIISIAEVYDMADGASVVIVGQVTRILASGKGFLVSDGEHSINIYSSKTWENATIGAKVKIAGELDIYNGLYEVKPDTVDVYEGTVADPVPLEITGVSDPTSKYLQSREATVTKGYLMNITGTHKTSSSGAEYDLVEATVVLNEGGSVLVRCDSRYASAEDFKTWGYDTTTHALTDKSPKKGQALTASGYVDFYNNKIQVAESKFISSAAWEGDVPKVPAPAAVRTTIAKLNEMTAPVTDTAYIVSGILETKKDTDKYGNGYLTDPATGETIKIYGATTTESALAWNDVDTFAFTNPKDAVTTLADIHNGEYVTMKVVFEIDYNATPRIKGVITAHEAGITKYKASVEANDTCTVALSKTEELVYGEEIAVTVTPATDGHVVKSAYVETAQGEKVSIIDSLSENTMKFKATVVNKVVVTCGEAAKPGDPITIAAFDLGLPGDYSAEKVEKTISGTTWAYTAVMKNTNNGVDAIQMNKAKNGVRAHIWNTVAFEKPIASVVINFGANMAESTKGKNVLCFESGTSEIATPGETYTAWDGNSTMTYTPATADCTFFSLSHHGSTSGATYITSIVVNFVA